MICVNLSVILRIILLKFSLEKVTFTFVEDFFVKIFEKLIFEVNSIALRLFSVYGENEHSKGKIANLISQIEWSRDKGERFDLYNEGKAIRDFIHVSDVVEAFINAMDSNIEYDIINIGTC